MSFSNPETTFDFVIVRLGGEIGIKSAWTRRTYEKRLVQNIKAALRNSNVPFEAVVRQQGRIYVKTSHAQKAALKLTRVFGISSLSPAGQTTAKSKDITEQSLKLAEQKLHKHDRFAVKCKRVGTHPYTSQDICKHIGQKILDGFPRLQLKVNLTNPDMTLGIEIRQNSSYIYADTVPASDGLPIGTQPKTIAIIKPDLNSSVASWLTMKRGCPMVPVYFSQNDNKNAIRKVRSICKALFEWSVGHLTKLYMLPHNQNLAVLKQECCHPLLLIINKRLIYRMTAQIAEKERAEAIVTGETIAQKPHRTLRQFKLQDQALQDYPIHRPLAGLTNAEIQKLAQGIGITKALTTKPIKPEAVKLRETVLPTLKEVEAAEKKLNIKNMIDTTLQKLETTTILNRKPSTTDPQTFLL